MKNFNFKEPFFFSGQPHQVGDPAPPLSYLHHGRMHFSGQDDNRVQDGDVQRSGTRSLQWGGYR